MAVESPSPLNTVIFAERTTDRQVAEAVATALGFPGTDKGTSIEPGMMRSRRDGSSTWVFAPVGKDAVFPGNATIARTPDVMVTDLGNGDGRFRIETGKVFTGDRAAFVRNVRAALVKSAN